MLYSIRGKIVDFDKKSIIVEVNDIGYEILVSNVDDYMKGEFRFFYLHHVIKQDDEYLVGFRSLDEKNAFKLLLNVQGIGPKSALAILANVTYDELMKAISNNDIEFIESIPGVSDRVASQILLDLKQYIARNNKENSVLYKEVKEILKSFKFKVKDIEKVLLKIYMPNASRDDIVKEALRRLKANE